MGGNRNLKKACGYFCFCTIPTIVIYFIAALHNKEWCDGDSKSLVCYTADDWSQTPCKDIQYLDNVVAWMVTVATIMLCLGVCNLYCSCLRDDGKKPEENLCNDAVGICFLCCFCGLVIPGLVFLGFVLDIWIKVRENSECEKFLGESFNTDIPLWIGIQIMAIMFVVSLSCCALSCLIMICQFCYVKALLNRAMADGTSANGQGVDRSDSFAKAQEMIGRVMQMNDAAFLNWAKQLEADATKQAGSTKGSQMA